MSSSVDFPPLISLKTADEQSGRKSWEAALITKWRAQCGACAQTVSLGPVIAAPCANLHYCVFPPMSFAGPQKKVSLCISHLPPCTLVLIREGYGMWTHHQNSCMVSFQHIYWEQFVPSLSFLIGHRLLFWQQSVCPQRRKHVVNETPFGLKGGRTKLHRRQNLRDKTDTWFNKLTGRLVHIIILWFFFFSPLWTKRCVFSNCCPQTPPTDCHLAPNFAAG